MPDLQVILNAIEAMHSSHNECMESLRNEMEGTQKAAAIHLSVEMELVNAKIKELSKHVAKQNGNVAALQAESLKRQEAVNDFRILEKNLSDLKKKLKERWLLLLLSGIFFVVIVILIYDIGGFPKMFEWLIGKIVK